MKQHLILCIGLIGAALAPGCKKDSNDTAASPSPNPAASPSAFQGLFSANIDDATQSFTVNASTGGQVEAARGTRLSFDPGVFRHADGSVVTGPVTVKVVEVLGIGDMIWLNKQTLGNDNGTLRLLKSGGALNITATQGGGTLRVAQGGLVVEVPTDVGDPNMQLFSGAEDADGNMIWSPIDSSSVSVDPGYVSLYYAFSADSLRWMNCDYFALYPDLTHISATIPAGQSTDSTLVWLAFPSENAVVGMGHTTGQSYAFPSYYAGVPVGMQAVVIGLRQSASGPSSSFTSITITPEMDVPMTFSPTTLEQFQEDIDGL